MEACFSGSSFGKAHFHKKCLFEGTAHAESQQHCGNGGDFELRIDSELVETNDVGFVRRNGSQVLSVISNSSHLDTPLDESIRCFLTFHGLDYQHDYHNASFTQE